MLVKAQWTLPEVFKIKLILENYFYYLVQNRLFSRILPMSPQFTDLTLSSVL